MPRKSLEQLISQATTDLPDNTAQLISPADVRDMFIDFMNSIWPAHGELNLDGPSSQTVGTDFLKVTFEMAYDENPAETTSAVPASTIIRAEPGDCEVFVHIHAELASNRTLKFKVFRDGNELHPELTIAGQGAANPVGVSGTIYDHGTSVGAVYELRAKSSHANTDVIFTNGLLMLHILPARGFVG
jgi:hypothetical protein